jgi:hypothetical protein
MGVDEARAALRAEFPELTPDDFKASAGSRDTLAKTVATKKGISEAEAKEKIDQIFTANGA